MLFRSDPVISVDKIEDVAFANSDAVRDAVSCLTFELLLDREIDDATGICTVESTYKFEISVALKVLDTTCTVAVFRDKVASPVTAEACVEYDTVVDNKV